MLRQAKTVTRFAPSPTGRLHLGHAYAALFAARAARDAGGRFLLRIEDIDPGRCRPEFESAIYEDLAWLGLDWEMPVRQQSEHMTDYAAVLDSLAARHLLYPCFCTRRDIQDEIARAGHAPHTPDGLRYPGTCRRMSPAERERRIAEGHPYALRLDMESAVAEAGALTWHDAAKGDIDAQPQQFGDVVLARKEIPTSYHLAVTVDDHMQGVTLVTRGHDLFAATHVHRLLQAMLGFNVPRWHHHDLLRDESGRRVAKRDNPLTLLDLRLAGRTPTEVRRLAGFGDV